MPKKRNSQLSNHTKNHSFSSVPSVDYKKRLNSFYKELKFLTFMSNKHEIARQDVLLTPDGPIELYRRDSNGKERYVHKNNLPKISDRSSRSFLNKISSSIDNYSKHSSTLFDDRSIYDSFASRSSIRDSIRDQNGQYGIAFDWYDPVGDTRILHEDVEVLPTRERSTFMSGNYDNYRLSYSSPPPRSSRAISYYSDEEDSSERFFNKHNYDIYEYYEYEVDDEDGKPRRFYSSRRRRSCRSPTPVPPIPIAKHGRRPHKIISYIDYDTYDNPKYEGVKFRHKPKNNRKSSQLQIEERPDTLSTSPKGKELWKKVDKLAQNERSNDASVHKEDTGSSKNKNNRNYDDNFILRESNKPDNEGEKPSFWGNLSLPQEVTVQQEAPIYSIPNVEKNSGDNNGKSSNNIVNFRNNFKKRAPIKSAMKIASEMVDSNKNSSTFDDLPGNNAQR